MRNWRENVALVIALAAIAVAAACAKKADDRTLVGEIESQIAADAGLKDATLQVTSDKGVVTLSGTVGGDAARLDAYKIAAQTPGVARVVDQMSVMAAPAAQANPGLETAAATTPASAKAAEGKREPARLREKSPEKAQQEEEAAAAEGGHGVPASPAIPAPEIPAPAASLPPLNGVTPDDEGGSHFIGPGPAPQPKDVLVPANTTMSVLMIDSVDSSVNHVGEIFHASLDAPIILANEVVVPKGADVYVRLSSATQAGRLHGKSELTLELVKLEFQGRSYSLESSTYSVTGASQNKSTAQKVGAGAVIGSIIGAVVGRGKGAAIGAAAGAGAGGIYQGTQKSKEVKVPSETRLDFLLDQPVTVTVVPHEAAAAQ
jgi:BON domain-containing protein